MKIVKTFEDFKNNLSQVSEKAISGGAVTKETAKGDELARFTVVLKATSDNAATISDANPAQSALELLVNNQDFKSWYAGNVTKSISGQNFDIPNSASIGFIETGKHRQAGFLTREKATETFVFKNIGTPHSTTRNQSYLSYDVKKFPAQAKATSSSGATIYAWNAEQEKDMTLSQAIPVNVNIAQLTVDTAMKTSAATVKTADVDVVTPGTGSQGSQGSQGSAGTAGSQTQKYAGLKLTQTFDQKIQDLQKLIVAKGGDAADAITAKGGAIGKYGSGTAKAIGILIGTNKEENEITADIDAKLQTALAGVTVPAATGSSAAKSGSGKVAKSATKTPTNPNKVATATTVKTKKGTLTF
jgi:hypothetical protein